MSLEENLDRVVARHQELSELMASATPLPPEEIARLGKEYSDLTPVVDAITELRQAQSEAADLAGMMADGDTDDDMKAMAEEEFAQLKVKIPALEIIRDLAQYALAITFAMHIADLDTDTHHLR